MVAENQRIRIRRLCLLTNKMEKDKIKKEKEKKSWEFVKEYGRKIQYGKITLRIRDGCPFLIEESLKQVEVKIE